MGTIFSREWGGTNGNDWTTVDFAALISSGALIQSSAGWGPTVGGTERIYRATAFPQTTGYTVDLDATWDDAAGTGRYVGIAVRCTSDGACYSLELDSNVGTSRCRIRRRSSAGSWTTVSAYASPAGIPNSAAMNSGVTMTARVENTDADEVTVTLYNGATELASYTDTSANRIESGGTAGVVLDANWTDDDIIVDNLIVADFEDEWAGDGALDEGLALAVDGTFYSWEDLQAAGITVGVARQTYTMQPVCNLVDTLKLGETSTVLYSGAAVKVHIDGNVVASGRLRTASESWDTREGRTYELASPKQLAADVMVSDPDWGTDQVRFNMPTDAEDYVSNRSDFEIGECIAYLIDNNLDGDGALRDQLAAPADGATYTPAELDAMDATIPELEVRGDIVTAVESLLSYTKYVLFIDPDTLAWEFHERNAGTIRTVDVGTTFAQGESRITPERNATALVVLGSRPETTMTTLAVGSGLQNGWPSGLDSTYSWEKAHKNRDAGIVSSIGTSGGKVTMTPTGAFSMVADEWLECRVKFTSGSENDNVYDVDDNSGTTFTFTATSWQSGGPSATDTFEVYGNKAGGGKDNGYSQVGRRFELTDSTKGIPTDACVTATVFQDNIQKIVKLTHITPSDGSTAASVELDSPALSLINIADPTSPEDPCLDGAAVSIADISIELPLYDRTDPSVPRYRYPTSGFYGDSYTVDSDKWSGGGKPGRGDPAVMREHQMTIPAYDGSAAMDTEMATLAADVLAVLSPLSREVRLTFAGLNFDALGLDSRLQISRTGGSTGVWSSLTNLGILAVEWDPLRKTTTYYAGTQASWDYDIEGMRREFMARSQSGHYREMAQKVRNFLECMNGTPMGSGAVGAAPPSQVCGEQISVTGSSGGVTTVSEVSMENIAGGPNISPVEACNSFTCVTSFSDEAGKLIANADGLDGTIVTDQQTKDFDVTKDRCGDPLGGSEISVVEAVVWLMEQVKVLTYGVVAITGAHDQELTKANADLASIRGNLDGLVACINAGWAAIDTCFKRRQVVTEHTTGCELVDCSHSFTETVCEDPCDTDESVKDASSPPDISKASC